MGNGDLQLISLAQGLAETAKALNREVLRRRNTRGLARFLPIEMTALDHAMGLIRYEVVRQFYRSRAAKPPKDLKGLKKAETEFVGWSMLNDEARDTLLPAHLKIMQGGANEALEMARIAANGGIESRWARHQAMQQRVERWIVERGPALGIDFLPREGRRSWTVSCIRLPAGELTGGAVAKRMESRGIVIGAGYKGLKDTTFRIGHMGLVTDDEIKEVIAALKLSLPKVGFKP